VTVTGQSKILMIMTVTSKNDQLQVSDAHWLVATVTATGTSTEALASSIDSGLGQRKTVATTRTATDSNVRQQLNPVVTSMTAIGNQRQRPATATHSGTVRVTGCRWITLVSLTASHVDLHTVHKDCRHAYLYINTCPLFLHLPYPIFASHFA